MSPANRLLIQVVPRLMPAQCGVSDQATLLAEELKTAFGIGSAFVVLNSDQKCNLPYAMVHCPPASLLDVCLSLSDGEPGAILTHVSGYGYSADGAPTLLADAIARVRQDGRFRVAAYFHELFATGMPWRSAFWHSRRQKKAVRSIAGNSDLIVTSVNQHADWLERECTGRNGAPVQRLPVYSACGEAAAPTPAAQREPAMAVFGLPASRQRAYGELSSLGAMLKEAGIKEIVDIGPGSDVPAELSGIPVRRRGVLPAADLAGQLSQTMFGFLAHAPAVLGKSSVFAAYCAQGVIPVIANAFHGEVGGLEDGVQLLSPETVKAAKHSGFEECSLAAWRWYQGHRVRVHASTYARWLDQAPIGAGVERQTPAEVNEG